MKASLSTVLGWAEEIADRLGAPAGSTVDVEAADGPADAPGALVTLTFADGSSSGAHYDEELDGAEALALLADQLQEAVLEAVQGRPSPACPGHGHPAAARAVDGTACWVCPETGSVLRPVLD
ncbi:hypothetical protein [Nocardiopsis composta]|uniref:Uncharacterized protein n=1 Tax=Nocardiopsis composta TaxID=157465 RepID=A0A7W8QL97_9ACTN|nr:hypothetical protein [Nocardiopsis composta]MBB5432527.1 hypothetical protein [Nocardiopsis composta]